MTSLLLPLVLSAAYSGHRPTSLGDPYLHLLTHHYPLGAWQADNLLAPPVVYGEDLDDLRAEFLDYLHRPWSTELVQSTGSSCVSFDKNTFKVLVNLEKFKPEEVDVKVNGDYLVVAAKHEEKSEDGVLATSSRALLRKYWLPKKVVADKLAATLSSDGVLTVVAPLAEVAEDEKAEEEAGKVEEAAAQAGVKPERKLEVVLTGKPAGAQVVEQQLLEEEEPSVAPAVEQAAQPEANQVEQAAAAPVAVANEVEQPAAENNAAVPEPANVDVKKD